MSSDAKATGPPKGMVPESNSFVPEGHTAATTNPHSRESTAQEGDWHKTHHDFQEHGHNPSRQKSVEENPDMALHYSHEHQHNHLHHGRASLSGRNDDILYSKGVDKAHVPDQDFSHHHKHPSRAVDAKDQAYSESDPEKGDLSPTKISTNETGITGEDGRKHRFSRFYRKYKIFFHLFIWLFFTG